VPRKTRSATRKPRRHRTASSPGQLELFPCEFLRPPVRSTPLERELLARAFDRIAKQEDDELLAAAVRRLRGRTRQWLPPMLEFTPMGLLGQAVVKVGQQWNDPALEYAGLRLMGYRVH
jgi:hypothetical protein